jgi:hypothetical protein
MVDVTEASFATQVLFSMRLGNEMGGESMKLGFLLRDDGQKKGFRREWDT